MRLRSGALAGAMALAATMSPENSLAEQSCTGRNEIMTLRFAEIQQELKVAAAECRAASDYKRFVHAYKPALDLSDQAMLSVFRDNSVSDTGTSAYAAFKAQLVSNSLLRSARNKPAFCAEARSEFSAAFSGQGALEGLISSTEPYVDLPFKDCGQTPQAPQSSTTVLAQQATPQAVAPQNVQVAQANIGQTPIAPPTLRPDPAELERVVPHHAPVVPAVPSMTRPASAPASAPQFDVAAPPPPPVEMARVVPHHAPVVPSIPQMTRPGTVAALAPQFAVSAPPAPIVAIARVVPHHTPFVPAVPAMSSPMSQTMSAPRFAITRESEPVMLARVVPHHRAFIPSIPDMQEPQPLHVRAPHIQVAQAEETFIIRRVVPRHSALRPATLLMAHPRPTVAEAPAVEIARAVPPAPPRNVEQSSSIARSLARLSAIAATMLKREAAAQAAERPAHVRPMVAAEPAQHPVTNADSAMAAAAARAADILHNPPIAQNERQNVASGHASEGTTRRRAVAANLVLPKQGIPLSALNATIEQSRVDEIAALPNQAVHSPVPASAQTAMNDQSAVVVAGRADLGTPKLAHASAGSKATTYGGKPIGSSDGSARAATNTPVQQAPSAALIPQNQDQSQDQNGDQQAAPNNQDDQTGPAYAYDDGYYNARARARAWRRHIIDALETYRRRSVPDDYSSDYRPPAPPPWRSNPSDDSWSDQ